MREQTQLLESVLNNFNSHNVEVTMQAVSPRP